MVVFVCSTPYQIMSAIAIKNAEFSNEQASIYILDYFNNSENICKRLRDMVTFDGTYYLKTKKIYEKLYSNDKKNSLFIKVKRVLYRLYYYNIVYKRFVYKNIKNVSDIDKLFSSYLDPVVVMLSKVLKKLGKKGFCYGYDDGLACYIDDDLDFKKNKMDFLYNIPSEVYIKKEYYLYNPKLISNYSKYKERLLPINIKKKETLDNINKLFGFNESMEIEESIIYFDSIEDVNFSNNIVSILKNIPTQKYIIKKHPRRMDDFYEKEKCNIYQYNYVPFEILNNNYDCDKKVFITRMSTSCVNSKIIFNQEPYIIFLYKLANQNSDYYNTESYDAIVDKLKRLYEHKERIIVPETWKQFEELIKKI